MKTLIVFFIPALFLISCGNNNRNEDVKTTDSLLQVVSEISKTVALYESDTAQKRYTDIKAEVDFIGQNLSTLPSGSKSNTISEYANCSKGFKRFFKDMFQIKTDNELSKKQLENLKKDISNNAISADETALYLAEEEKAVKDNNEKLKLNLKKYNDLCNETSACRIIITQVTDSLKKQLKIQ